MKMKRAVKFLSTGIAAACLATAGARASTTNLRGIVIETKPDRGGYLISFRSNWGGGRMGHGQEGSFRLFKGDPVYLDGKRVPPDQLTPGTLIKIQGDCRYVAAYSRDYEFPAVGEPEAGNAVYRLLLRKALSYTQYRWNGQENAYRYRYSGRPWQGTGGTRRRDGAG